MNNEQQTTTAVKPLLNEDQMVALGIAFGTTKDAIVDVVSALRWYNMYLEGNPEFTPPELKK